MQVNVSIGENHRFELREALLIYRDSQRSFVTGHEVSPREQAAPVLGPAQPLSRSFLEALSRSLNGSSKAEVLPANVLAKGGRMVAWWTPPQRRQMLYQNSEGLQCDLAFSSFGFPSIVWNHSDHGSMR